MSSDVSVSKPYATVGDGWSLYRKHHIQRIIESAQESERERIIFLIRDLGPDYVDLEEIIQYIEELPIGGKSGTD